RLENVPGAIRRSEYGHVRLHVAVEISRRPLTRDHAKKLEDRGGPREGHDIQLSVGVDAERADVAKRTTRAQFGGVLDKIYRMSLAGPINRQRNRPDSPSHEICVKVAAEVRRPEGQTSIDEAAGDRLAGAVVVVQNRIDQGQKGRRL